MATTPDEALADYVKNLQGLLSSGALPKHLVVQTNALLEKIRAHQKEKGAAKE